MAEVKSLMGLPGIRHRPSMYAGSSDSEGMWTSVREPLDNCADVAFEGKNKAIHLARLGKHHFAIWDEGPGIPLTPVSVENPVSHKVEKVNGLRAVVSLTHTGSKFEETTEADGQRGTHGVGIKLTNAVSTEFRAWTYRDRKWSYIEYSKGKLVTDTCTVTAPAHPVTGKLLKKGTLVECVLDPSVFDKGSAVPEERILEWFNITAAFSSGISFSYHDGEDLHEWDSTGAESFVASLVEEDGCTVLEGSDPLVVHGEFWDIALSFTDFDGTDVRGFTNGLHNPEGGTHVSAVFDAIAAVLPAYGKRNQKFKPSDLRDGLVGAVNVRLTACKFYNQAKTKLVDTRAGNPLRDGLIPEVEAYFKKHKSLAALLCERASRLSELKQEFQQNKRVMKVLKEAKRRNALPIKLASALNCTNEERELFLVEGDSAGGSAKQARDARYQEVLPLKGKIPNAYGTKAATVIETEEVLTLLMALGYDPSLDDPFSNIRVGRVIILTDADVDGLHIQNLILTVLVRFMPDLINEGRVYIAQRYEYLTVHKGQVWFAQTLDELAKLAPKAAMAHAMHLKGLGEVDPEVLAEMAFNPEVRRLTKLTPLDAAQIKRIATLAGTESTARKELLGV